jgi:hypothetical protein
MAYRAAAQHVYGAEGQVHLRFSVDEGVTWTAEDTFTDANPVTGAPMEGDGTNDCNTPLLIEAPNGDLLLLASEQEAVYSISNTSQWRSTDDGATWVHENVVANENISMDAVVIGTEIYAVGYTADGVNAKATLWKSTNNGVAWAKVSDVTTYAGDAISVDEGSLVHTGGNNLMVAMRDRGSALSFIRKSTDLGANWGTVMNPAPLVGIIQRPRLKVFADEPSRVYLFGRKVENTTEEWTIASISTDGGFYWSAPFKLEAAAQVDCGYCDVVKRTDGNLYVASYIGTYTAATIYEYILDV